MTAQTRSRASVLVIGIGNPYGGDDAAALSVAERLMEHHPSHVRIVEHSGEGASLMDMWRGAEALIVIDAVHSGAAPGTVYRFEADHTRLPTGRFHRSTHAFGVAEAIEIARALGRLPPRVTVYGIEGQTFEAGIGLTAPVELAVEQVTQSVMQEW